jgi:hypothetical protein
MATRRGPRFRRMRETRSWLKGPALGRRTRRRLERTPGIGRDTGLVQPFEEALCDLCWRSNFFSMAEERPGKSLVTALVDANSA